VSCVTRGGQRLCHKCGDYGYIYRVDVLR
jgi:hypothetical protein